MRVQVIDEQALLDLSPRNIRVYLRTHGWLRNEDSIGSDVWALSVRDGVYEVISPSTRQKRDFAKRASELLRTLSIAEDRSEIDVIRDLVTATYDIQYFTTHHEGPSGTAPLRMAADVFSSVVGLISASTATIEEPRLVLPSKRSSATNNFMKKVLAGPTTDGSYVVSIWVPVPPQLTPEEDQVLFDGLTEPFERRATRHLNRSLIAARMAAQEVLDSDKGLDAFTERSSDGISANLCEAILALAGGEEGSSIDVRFAWALDRPVGNIQTSVTYPAETLPVFREAAREMRERIPEDEVLFRGNVVRLHRDTQLGPGDVTIAGSVVDDPSEKFRRVSVNLSEVDYQSALVAHETFGEVEIFGSLQQRGTRTYLVTHHGLTVMSSSP